MALLRFRDCLGLRTAIVGATELMADANQVWPRIRINIIDIVQPAGISISQHIVIDSLNAGSLD